MADDNGKEGKKFLDVDVDTNAFEALEREVQEVLQELVGDQTLERFRVEYEKLYRSVKKSHDNEKRLIKKCRELNAEIVANAAKVQTALKLSDEDQNTINALKKEVEKAWKQVEEAREKENGARDTIRSLKVEINNLQRLVEQGTGLSLGSEEDTLNELLKQKDEVARERDGLVEQILKLRNESVDTTEKLKRAEQDKLSLIDEITSLKDQINAKKLESERQLRAKEKLEREVKDLRSALDSRQNEIRQKTALVQQAEESLGRYESSVRDQKAQADRMKREYNALVERALKLQQELDDQGRANTQLESDISLKTLEMKAKEDEINALRAEVMKITKLKEATLGRIKTIEKLKADVEKDRDSIKQDMYNLEREVEALRRELAFEKKKEDELLRERDVLAKKKEQVEASTQKHVDLLRINENNKKTLESEIEGYRAEAQVQARNIAALEREKEKYSVEAAEASSKYMQALEEVKVREMAIVDLQKKIAETEARLKQQQNLYEAVRSDRNLYSKNLIESQDEIQELKRKFKIMNHQIEQLKEEISSKDLALVKEHFDHMKVEKEKESLRFELNKAKQQIKEADAAITAQRSEIEKLNHIINEADLERARQKKEFDLVVNERDILGTQLIRRNDELALLYEKIKIQQSTLNKGQIQYRERLNEIRVLKIKVNDLRRELTSLRTNVSNVDVLKREVHQLGRELLREKAKVKALSEELENPLNVHRWRKLEGSDPTAFEMIQKIQTLQKRLITKTEEVIEKDLLIQEKEKLYLELKNILARQPGPEVAEQLSVYQQTLRDKTRQMKSMASELNMYQAQVSEYKYEIERLVRELNEVKRRYFETKRKDQLQSMGKTAPPSQFANAQSLASAAGLYGVGQPNPLASETDLSVGK